MKFLMTMMKRIINSIILCLRFPFLYPRNRFSGRHEVYPDWFLRLTSRIENKTYEVFNLQYRFHKDPFLDRRFIYSQGKYTIFLGYKGILTIMGPLTSETFDLQSHVGMKKFKVVSIEPYNSNTIIYHVCMNEATDVNYGFAFKQIKVIKSYFNLRILHCLEWFRKHIMNLICFIPTFTELDAMPVGWRKAFGIELCKEIKKELKKHNYLRKYRIMQIKEKYSELRLYDCGSPNGCIQPIIDKYTDISYNTCIICGKPAHYHTEGYILPYCDEHKPSY